MNTPEGMTLDPCPFCGGEAEFERVGTPRWSCIVTCRNCGARHESSDENERSGMSWNSRAAAAHTPPEQPAETCGLDTPLPCDIDLGGASFGKGVALRLLVKAARRWREDAYGKAPTGEVADRALAVLQGRINPQPADQALRWATELAVSMARKFYPDAPQFEPLPDLVGVISQIDNMTTGLCRKPEQPAAQGELSDEQIDDCMPLGIAPYSTLVGRVEIRRFARAVIAADRAARKRPEAEVAGIMGAKRALVLAAIAAGVAKVGSTEDVQEQLNADLRSADANFERLVRGEKP